MAKYISTIGIDFGVKPVNINGQSVRVNFWDLAGGDEYFEIRNEFYKDAQGALLVFDVSDRKSFEVLDKWISEAQKHQAKGLALVVCANKTDGKRSVSEAEGKKWAAANSASYFETSAKEGDNINKMFDSLFQKVCTGK